jgi:hypothetical protein
MLQTDSYTSVNQGKSLNASNLLFALHTAGGHEQSEYLKALTWFSHMQNLQRIFVVTIVCPT